MPLFAPRVSPAIEPLEARQFFSLSWGATAELIHQNDAYDAFTSITGAGQVIAVIDSGIDYTHPALGGGFGLNQQVIGGYDFADNDADPIDQSGHGTEVAGVIAASQFTANGSIYQGIAPGAKLVALRVDDGDGFVPDERVESALRWIIDHPEFGVGVVNISYGSGHYDEPFSSPVFGDEIAILASRNIITVAADGNDGVSTGPGIDGPAADPNVIGVGSVSAFNVISDFSERGALTAVLAPGETVYTTLLNNTYGSVTGTSFSAPAVAGAVALARSIDPTLTLKDLRSSLAGAGATVKDGDDEVGAATSLSYARLDLYGLLKITAARRPASSADSALFGRLGNTNSIAVDRFGVTHLAYYDSEATTMKYATRSASGQWSALQTIDTSAPTMGIYVSLAVNAQGKPAVAYFDGNAGDLKYAEFDGQDWQSETIDGTGSVGLYPSIVIDNTGNPAISYYRKSTGDLRVARRSNDVWTIRAVDYTNNVGRSTTMALDSAGKLGIAYEDSTTGYLKFAKDIVGGSWGVSTIDSTISGVSFMSLAFDASNNAAISYYDANPADLKFARQVSGSWSLSTLATRGAVGLYTSLFFDAGNLPNILYYDRRNNGAYRAIGQANGTFSSTLIAGGTGKFISSALDVTTGKHLYTAFDTTTLKLGVGTLA